MPGMAYEERRPDIGPGDNVLLYSDGLVEAHDPSGEMYGFPRLRADMAIRAAGSELLDELLERLHAFTGPGWEQEDDITLVTLRRRRRRDRTPVEPDAPAVRDVARRVRAAGRAGQRARRRWTASPTRSRPLGLRPGPPGTAEDGRQRDRHERHRVRLAGRPGGPGRDPRRRRTASCASGSPTARLGGADPRRRRRGSPISTPSSPASRSRAAGACS